MKILRAVLDHMSEPPSAPLYRFLALLCALVAWRHNEWWSPAIMFAVLAASTPERPTYVTVQNVRKFIDEDDIDFIADSVERRQRVREEARLIESREPAKCKPTTQEKP